MSKIATLIFSKDRGAQLELLLRSMKNNMEIPSDTTILYTTSSPESEQCYNLLKEEYGEHVFIKESEPFHDHVKSYVMLQEAPYTLLMCDDEVMYRKYNLEAFLPHIDRVLAVSLRLGTNTSYCFAQDKIQSVPKDTELVDDKFMVWSWDAPTASMDFAYPMSVTDHIYHTEFLKYAMVRIPFTSVNSLESSLDFYKKMLTKPGPQQYLMAPIESIFYSIPLNLVQNEYTWNKVTTVGLDLDEATARFLKGERLEIEEGVVDSCHCDFTYKWEPLRNW